MSRNSRTVLIISNDNRLLAAAEAVPFARSIRSNAASALAQARRADVLVADLDDCGALEFIAKATSLPGVKVIAVASRGLEGSSLEHALLRAELSGAGAAYPKPMDAADLADALRAVA